MRLRLAALLLSLAGPLSAQQDQGGPIGGAPIGAGDQTSQAPLPGQAPAAAAPESQAPGMAAPAAQPPAPVKAVRKAKGRRSVRKPPKAPPAVAAKPAGEVLPKVPLTPFLPENP